MPEFLEKKLRQEYGNNARAIYGTMNEIGAMHGNKETAKGREMEQKHMAKEHAAPFASTHIDHHGDGSHTVRHEQHPKRSKSPAFYERADADTYSASTGPELMSKLESKLKIKHNGAEGKSASSAPEPIEREDGDEEGGTGDGGEME